MELSNEITATIAGVVCTFRAGVGNIPDLIPGSLFR
jgi:hypothetical protein